MENLKEDIEEYREKKGFWRDLIDNETLIITALIILAILDPSFRSIIVAAFLTMIGNTKRKKNEV